MQIVPIHGKQNSNLVEAVYINMYILFCPKGKKYY